MSFHTTVWKLRVLNIVATLAMVATVASAETAVRPASDGEAVSAFVDEAMAYLGFEASHKQTLLEGKVLFTSMPGMEPTKNVLAVAGAMLIIRRPITEVVDAYMDGQTFRQQSEIMAYKLITETEPEDTKVEADFAGIHFTAEETSEVQKLHRVKPSSKFNFSEDEIARLRAIDRHDDAATEEVSAVYRRVLLQRYRSYLRSGLAGVKPYARKDGKSASPSRELTAAIRSARFLEKHFPAFHATLLKFPDGGIDRSAHRFYWIKQTVDERPAFVLSHHTIDIRDRVALVAEQQFYVGHTYNSMLMLIGAVPYEGGTLVFGANRTFTDKVVGFASGLKHKVGRKRVAELLTRHFEKLRAALEQRNK